MTKKLIQKRSESGGFSKLVFKVLKNMVHKFLFMMTLFTLVFMKIVALFNFNRHKNLYSSVIIMLIYACIA